MYIPENDAILCEVIAAYDFPELEKKRKEMIESDIPNG